MSKRTKCSPRLESADFLVILAFEVQIEPWHVLPTSTPIPIHAVVIPYPRRIISQISPRIGTASDLIHRPTHDERGPVDIRLDSLMCPADRVWCKGQTCRGISHFESEITDRDRTIVRQRKSILGIPGFASVVDMWSSGGEDTQLA